jgi:hypothetical protein
MRALQSYLLTLVWIQLWPPVYAILNYKASIASAKHIAAAAELGAGINGLAIVSASAVYSNTISDQAVVGYLVLAVPAIAWAAVKGMHTIGRPRSLGPQYSRRRFRGRGGHRYRQRLDGMVSQDHVNLSPTYSSAPRASTDAWGARTIERTVRWRSAAQREHEPLAARFEFSSGSHVDVDSARTLEATARSQRRRRPNLVCNSRQCNERAANTLAVERGQVGVRRNRGRDSRDVNTCRSPKREQDARL